MPKISILAIESSADETGAAVLQGDIKLKKFQLLSNVIYSQIKIHQKTGGIVPEVAARNHILKILPIIEVALQNAKLNLRKIDAIAVTAGPGLITSLMIGVDTAKALSFALRKPIIPVNHMEGHLLSALGPTSYELQATSFPALGLVVSGGHTMLVLVKKIGKYKLLGETLDDAAGECFDKVAKIMNLPYPGGPAISTLAKKGDPKAIDFPRPLLGSKDYNFSFSGLKTAVLYFLRDHPKADKADVAASVQQAIMDVLISKTMRAGRQYKVKTVLLGGGVSANAMLRAELDRAVKKNLKGSRLYIPEASLTTDNAGMIAIAAFFQAAAGRRTTYDKVMAKSHWELTKTVVK